MRKMSVWYVACLITVGLAACASTTPAVPATTEQLPTATEAPVITEASPEATESVTAASSPEVPVPSPVVVLVVDDFGPPGGYTVAIPDLGQEVANGQPVLPPDNSVEPSKPTFSMTDNCVADPNGQAHFSTGGVSHYATGGVSHYGTGGVAIGGSILAHGQLVSEQLRHSIDPAGQLAKESAKGASALNTNSIRDIALYHTKYGDIVVAEVDTLGYTTTAVHDHILEAVRKFSQGWTLSGANIPGANRFVINMSFAVIPCDESLNLVERPDIIDGYVNLLGKHWFPNLETLFKDALGLSTAKGDIDSMLAQANIISRPEFAPVRIAYSYLYLDNGGWYIDMIKNGQAMFNNLQSEFPKGVTVFWIGAAGNSTLSVPFAPAIWDGVLSVSADYVGPFTWAFEPMSNAGEVRVSGIHYRANKSPNPALVGTSFAAPQVSAQAAYYILGGGSIHCSGQTGDSEPPLNHQDYDNLSLDIASADYCTGFMSLSPSSP